ncbi:MAG: type II secretion system protein [Acidobacteriota bacterium]|jgi:prepilin-type N-terminal cleavage/methylation domain-containing protein
MRRESGFTLLEVLVALTVLAVGAALTLSLISGSLGNIRRVRLHTGAMEHAQDVLELTLQDDTIRGATTLGGDFEDGTRWSVVVTEVEMPLPDNVQSLFQTNSNGSNQGAVSAMAPPKVLSYLVQVTEPDSRKPDFQLQTLKLVNPMELPGTPQVQR